MTITSAPKPIPYQGSKRQLVPTLLRSFPRNVATLYEPFAGSGAVTIGAAMAGLGQAYVLSDSLPPLVGIWAQILGDPDALCAAYAEIWKGERGSYEEVRARFNERRQPADLLYLIARCVKNAVRFNAQGAFNQAPDRRRLGMKPALLQARVAAVHALLARKASAACADYAESLRAAAAADLVYMDPPYMGVSGSRDPRYHQGLDLGRFVAELGLASARGVSFLVSFDGNCGERTYGPGLPAELGLTRMNIKAGRSSQSTLNGGTAETVESLYLSPSLVERLGREGVGR